jgi:charged multivesicular body protein 7
MASGEGEGVEGWEAAVRAEVGAGWWDDPDGDDLRARFKAFTGQRCDWPEPKLLFWKDLILRVARRLRLCSAPAHLVSDLHLTSEGSFAFASDTMTATTAGDERLVRPPGRHHAALLAASPGQFPHEARYVGVIAVRY